MVPQHRRAKSESSATANPLLHSSRIEVSADPCSTAGPSAHVNLTTEDVSSLLSRIACLEAEIKEATSRVSSSRRKDSLTTFSTFCFPSSRVLLRQPQLQLSPSPCICGGSDAQLVKTLLSLPLMKTFADIVVKSITAGSVANIENDLLLEIQDAAQNPSSPWSKLAPPPPAVSGPRTPEHYLAALDVAIKARKDAMNCRKVANFWKRLALQVCPDSNDVALLTPSPSDISDAGPEELPPLRQARMKDLIEKRGLVLPSPTALAPTASIGVSASKANPGVSENDGRSAIKESIASKLTLRLDFDHNRSDSDSSIYFSSGSPTFLSSDSDINDETLLDTKNESASEPSTPIKERPLTIVDVCNSAVLPEKNMSLPYSPPATFPSKLKTKAASFNPPVASKRVLPSPPSSTSKNPHSPRHNSCTRPASTPTPPNRRMSNIPLTSVQTKRRMYESLVSVPNARPSPSPAPASSNNKGSSSSSHLSPTARAKYGQIASQSNIATPSVASTKKYTTPSTIRNASTGIPSSRYGTERGAPHLKSLALPHVRCVPSNIGKDSSSSPQNCRSDPSVLVQGSTRAGSVLTDVPPHVRARRIFR